MGKRESITRLAHIRNTKRVQRFSSWQLNNSKDKTNIEDIADPSHAASIPPRKGFDLSIWRDDNLIPEQRKKTGQLGHHRSASHTKGRRIHDRSVGSKVDGQTTASVDKKRHKLPRAQIGESGRSSEFKDCRQVTCREGTLCKVRSLRFLLKFCSSSGSNRINFCTVERVLTMHRFLKSALLYCCNL